MASIDSDRRTSFTYRAQSPLMMAIWLIVLPLAFVAFEWGGIVGLTNVELQCNRHVGTCTITPSLPFSGGVRTVPIASIRRAELVTSGSGSKAAYSVALVTDSGRVALSNRSSGDRGQRAQAKADIDRFLADRKADTLEVDYDQPVMISALFMLFGFAWLYALFALVGATRIEVDPARGTVAIVRLRGPFRTGARQTLSLADVTDATVVSHIGSKGSTFYVAALVVAGSEAPVRLLDSSSSDSSWHELAAQRIRALLVRPT